MCKPAVINLPKLTISGCHPIDAAVSGTGRNQMAGYLACDCDDGGRRDWTQRKFPARRFPVSNPVFRPGPGNCLGQSPFLHVRPDAIVAANDSDRLPIWISTPDQVEQMDNGIDVHDLCTGRIVSDRGRCDSIPTKLAGHRRAAFCSDRLFANFETTRPKSTVDNFASGTDSASLVALMVDPICDRRFAN